MGNADRIIRIILAIVFGALYFTHTVDGILAGVLLVLGVIFLVTPMISFCPLYAIFGLRTCPKE